MYRIHIGSSAVEIMLGQMAGRLGDMTPAMQEVGEIAVSSSHRNFREGRGPDGAPWKPSLRAVTEGGQTLVKSARMKNSITAAAFPTYVEVGTNVIYAAIHQWGGRTPPHVIRPRRKKALAWPGGGPFAKVNHPGSVIPARPFVGVRDDDWPSIDDVFLRHVMEA